MEQYDYQEETGWQIYSIWQEVRSEVTIFWIKEYAKQATGFEIVAEVWSDETEEERERIRNQNQRLVSASCA